MLQLLWLIPALPFAGFLALRLAEAGASARRTAGIVGRRLAWVSPSLVTAVVDAAAS